MKDKLAMLVLYNVQQYIHVLYLYEKVQNNLPKETFHRSKSYFFVSIYIVA